MLVIKSKIIIQNILKFVDTGHYYLGSGVPKPLRVKIAEVSSPIKIIATDIMNLTKLDWNTTTSAKSLPVTISVSKKWAKEWVKLRLWEVVFLFRLLMQIICELTNKKLWEYKMIRDFYYFNRRYQKIEDDFLELTDFIEIIDNLNDPN